MIRHHSPNTQLTHAALKMYVAQQLLARLGSLRSLQNGADADEGPSIPTTRTQSEAETIVGLRHIYETSRVCRDRLQNDHNESSPVIDFAALQKIKMAALAITIGLSGNRNALESSSAIIQILSRILAGYDLQLSFLDDIRAALEEPLATAVAA